jgi:hypothetical protein
MKRSNEAWRSANLFDAGCGYLVVSRLKGGGRIEAGFFLLDLFCLGVKDAGFVQFGSYEDYRKSLLERLFSDEESVQMAPAAGRKLAEDAVAYARGLGFSPGVDYKKACRIFGGISTAECDEQFVFGKDGKPFYIQGPSESPERAEWILRVLEARCGKGGYHYIVAAADFEPPDSARKDGDADAGDSAGLEAMAARVQAEKPGLEVEINPPGRRRVSDMIALVAEPLLESAPDYEARRTILTIAALAWNFSLFDLPVQRRMLADVAGLFPGSEGVEMFLYLVARAATLFPDEDRLICDLETEPDPFGDVALRVASVM